MSINLKQAFTYAWTDKDFFTKWAIGSFILVFPTIPAWLPGIKRLFENPANGGWLLFFIIASLIVYLAMNGYFYKAVHNRIVHSAEHLPDWSKFWYYVKIGLKCYLGSILFALPYAALLFGVFYLIQPDIKSPIFLLLVAILYIFISAIYTVFSLNFAIKVKISAFLNYKRAFRRIKGRWCRFLKFYAYCLAINIVCTCLLALLSLTGLTSLLLPFVAFYFYLVFADLYSQFLFD